MNLERANEISRRLGVSLIPSPRILAFGLVGCAAAAVHFSVVCVLVPLHLPPLLANVFGFLVAFGVSFAGHDRWTFPSQGRAKRPAAARFFVVACTAFVLNETLYALLLLTGLDYRPALLLVLATVALMTWLWSKHWAFADG